MALQTANIGTELVKTALGISTNIVSELCRSSSINKFSKYKPVIGPWPQGTDGKYGLDIPASWDYTHPINTFRLGDFSGYAHDASLPFQVKAGEFISGQTLDSSAVFKFQIIGANNITVTDLNLNSYFLGIQIDTSYYTADCSFGEAPIPPSEPSIFNIYVKDYSVGPHNWYAYIASQKAVGYLQGGTKIYAPYQSGATEPSGTFEYVMPKIEVSTAAMVMASGINKYAYNAINVSPDTLDTSIVKIDTGDGTSWALITVGGLVKGDREFVARSIDTSTNITQMNLKIADASSLATPVYVLLTHQASPA
jgi:hypothetical protein